MSNKLTYCFLRQKRNTWLCVSSLSQSNNRRREIAVKGNVPTIDYIVQESYSGIRYHSLGVLGNTYARLYIYYANMCSLKLPESSSDDFKNTVSGHSSKFIFLMYINIIYNCFLPIIAFILFINLSDKVITKEMFRTDCQKWHLR